MSTLDVNGASIHYEDRGEGSALVLVHGGLGAGSEWDLIAEELARSFRVISPDSRGHGRSTNPAGELSYPQLADDLAAVVKALGLDRPVVVGWSDGGQTALELGVRHPDLADALVVGGAYHEFERSGLRDVHENLLAEIEEDPGDQELRELIALQDDWDALLAQTKGLWLGYAGLADEELARMAVPSLVLTGDRDEIVPFDLILKLRRILPDSELAVVPRASHEGPFTVERSSIFATLIGDFAERHQRTTDKEEDLDAD